MKNYWGNWILSSTLIFVCISFLLLSTWSPLMVSARRTRSSRHHKPKHSEYNDDKFGRDFDRTTESSFSENNSNDTTTAASPVLKSANIQVGSYDVCQGWWCGHGRECQRGSDGLPSCICMRECPDRPPSTTSTNVKNREGNSNDNKNGYLEYGKGFEEFYEPFPGSELIFPPDTVAVRLNEFKPVCGSDGKIYPNQCELYRTACITNHPYLHVDDSEESCRHVVAPGGESVDSGRQNPSLPPFGTEHVSGSGGGRDQDAGRRGSGARGGSAPGTGGNSNTGNRDNPFGESPSYSGPGGSEFPFFSTGNIPSFGGVDIPYSPNGDVFGQSDFSGSFAGDDVGISSVGDEADKFIPSKTGRGTNTPGSNRHNEKEKAKDGTKNHGKALNNIKNTGFEGNGAKAAAEAAAVTFPKWALPGLPIKNQFNMEDLSDEEDEDEDDEDDDDDDDISGLDENDEEYNSEVDDNSFLDENKLPLFEDSETNVAQAYFNKVVATKASLDHSLLGNGKQRRDGISTMTDIKGISGKKNNQKYNENVALATEENENGARKGRKNKRKNTKKAVMKKTWGRGSQIEPKENRWDLDDEHDKVYKNDAPFIKSTNNNNGHEEGKPDGSIEMDDQSWRMNFRMKKNRKSASKITEDDDEDDDDSLPPSSRKGELKTNSVGIVESRKSDGKTFLPGTRRGSSLCSREEYEILKDALLIYNHHHLIGDSGPKKKSKKEGRKHSQSYQREGRHKNDNDEDDEEKVEQSVDDDNDNDVEDDSNEKDEKDDGEEERRQEGFADSSRARRRFGYEDESTFEKEYLLSLMFAHFDQNNNGKLDYAELQKVGMEQKIERPATIHCHLVDFLRFDDMDHDNLISPNEFYAAFSKLYSISILGIGKPRSPIYLTSRVGEMLEIKCSVGAGSVSTVPESERKHRKAMDENSSDSDDDNENENENRDNDLTGNERGDGLDYSNNADEWNNNNNENGRRRKTRKFSSIISSSSYSPMLPTTQWFRYGVDVSKLINLGEQFQIHKDGTLLINRVELIHAGNYSCHDDRGNEKVIQPYVLAVQMAPDVQVRPHIKWERPGQDVLMECRAQGEPLPAVRWLKNDNPVIPSKNNKYTIAGDGITLKVKDINFSDTAAYTCQAQNEAGKRIDISSLVVIDEQALPPVQYNESQFLVFHERGISTYDPENCRLQHQILATDIIPGTQRDYICGSSAPSSCEWGRALRVSSVYVYVSQPKLNRVLIISISQMVVVDVVSTDRLPVELHYVPQVDQVWIECWKEEEPYTTKTLQVIRGAKEKKKHRAVRPKPLVSLEADLVQNVFLPPAYSPFISLSTTSSPSSPPFFHAYISHKNTRGLYKMDLRTLRYTKSIDLTSYNCLPEQVHFTALYGFIILECKEPVLHQPTGQLVLDSISDAIISYKADLNGPSFLSPDSRKLVTMVQSRHDSSGGTILLQQHVEANGLRIAFDVNTSLNISDVNFFPSQRFHTSYDLYATAVDKEDVLFVDLHSGNVELVPGVGRALQNPSWERTQRPIASENLFGKYLVTPSSDAVYVVNGRSHTVNCQIGGMARPSIVVWL